MMKCINKGCVQLANGSLVDLLECTSIFSLSDNGKIVFQNAYPNRLLKSEIELNRGCTDLRLISTHGMLLKNIYIINKSKDSCKNSLYSFHIFKNDEDYHQQDFFFKDNVYYKSFESNISKGLTIPPLSDLSIKIMRDNNIIDNFFYYNGILSFDLKRIVQ